MSNITESLGKYVCDYLSRNKEKPDPIKDKIDLSILQKLLNYLEDAQGHAIWNRKLLDKEPEQILSELRKSKRDLSEIAEHIERVREWFPALQDLLKEKTMTMDLTKLVSANHSKIINTPWISKDGLIVAEVSYKAQQSRRDYQYVYIFNNCMLTQKLLGRFIELSRLDSYRGIAILDNAGVKLDPENFYTQSNWLLRIDKGVENSFKRAIKLFEKSPHQDIIAKLKALDPNSPAAIPIIRRPKKEVTPTKVSSDFRILYNAVVDCVKILSKALTEVTNTDTKLLLGPRPVLKMKFKDDQHKLWYENTVALLKERKIRRQLLGIEIFKLDPSMFPGATKLTFGKFLAEIVEDNKDAEDNELYTRRNSSRVYFGVKQL